MGSLLNQLAIANESLSGGTVMAERDKEEMELDIAKMEFDFKGTSVICRSGSPPILADLKKVSVSNARAVVVLAEDGNADQVALPGGKITLNPDASCVLQEGDEVLVLAEDDDTYSPSTLHVVNEAVYIDIVRPTRKPQKILLCGWRRDIDDMIVNEREKKLIDGGLDFSQLENILLVNREGNAVIRWHLESLPLQSFDFILILADESVEDSAIQADSRSLATLLLIRDIQVPKWRGLNY
ncbi:hypothetical protein J5N97_020207 [Dioscorea zingiberensis]|uniref:CASTOR/POLLUX/SYM8 ion channel conserved domain-containing protein n=1 Tax=Dioscorea zingiberensis TaxID=325984 RepID=A0A9D5CGL8_9LILI|nr:hypothetical protein J5N97_020207 [Dioscorea zingiberensis]